MRLVLKENRKLNEDATLLLNKIGDNLCCKLTLGTRITFPHTRVGIHCSYPRGTGGAPQNRDFLGFCVRWRHRGYLWIEDDEERPNMVSSQRS